MSRNSKAIPIFAHPFRKPKTLRAFTVPKSKATKGRFHPLTFTGGRVSFISLPCSFAFGLGLTEALHVVPYQRDPQ